MSSGVDHDSTYECFARRTAILPVFFLLVVASPDMRCDTVVSIRDGKAVKGTDVHEILNH